MLENTTASPGDFSFTGTTHAAEHFERELKSLLYDIENEHEVVTAIHGGVTRPPKPVDGEAHKLFNLVREAGAALGFAELSIRNYAEDCTTNRVAYLEGWYVEPHARRRGVGRALVQAARPRGGDTASEPGAPRRGQGWIPDLPAGPARDKDVAHVKRWLQIASDLGSPAGRAGTGPARIAARRCAGVTDHEANAPCARRTGTSTTGSPSSSRTTPDIDPAFHTGISTSVRVSPRPSVMVPGDPSGRRLPWAPGRYPGACTRRL